MKDFSKLRSLISLTVLAAMSAAMFIAQPAEVSAGPGAAAGKNIGVIRGVVRDLQGSPIAGATVAIFRVGTSQLLHQVNSNKDGRYLLRIIPGKYSVLAVAQGFNPVTLQEVAVGRASELDYGFRLERAGSGNTLPERRLDRNNPKWVKRAATLSRSVYQNQEGETPVIETEEAALKGSEIRSRPGRSVAETYIASSDKGVYTGINYATQLDVSDKTNMVIAAQTGIGPGAPQRLETHINHRASSTHTLRFRTSISLLGSIISGSNEAGLGQLSMQATDEWRVREGVVLVLGADYSKFMGAGNDFFVSPRIGLQYDVDSKTRLRAAYTTHTDERTWGREIELEESQIIFREPVAVNDIVVDEGRPQINRSRRFEFGLERVLDNRSSIEANAFFDTTFNRGVGIQSLAFDDSLPVITEFTGNQSGSATGIRLVYSRRITDRLSASGGYSFGTGQKFAPDSVTNPGELFKNDVFHTLYGQIDADIGTGTNVKTVFRLSPQATVFAIDPFRGRLAIYDPSLSILVTQSLPNLGLPFQAEAVIDARNLLDLHIGALGEDGSLRLNGQRRSVRGGILVRF